MEWYWWVLIVIGVIVIGWAKLKVFSAWQAKRKAQAERIEEDDE